MLVDALRSQALAAGERVWLRFLDERTDEVARLTFSEVDRAARATAAQLAGCRSGDRALLIYPPGLDVVGAFLGCLYAGVVAVLAPSPDDVRHDRWLARMRPVVTDAQPGVVLTSRAGYAQRDAWLPELPAVAQTPWIVTGGGGNAEPVPLARDALAFLQYTSGSTREPRGVMVTHGNLAHNLTMRAANFAFCERDVFVHWLPLTHDAGLIGMVLQSLAVGAECVMMAPQTFISRPAGWVEAISKYRGTVSHSPNFGYELAATKTSPAERAALDLACWTRAITGAEPVRAATMELFATTFADRGFARSALYPGYGLAEGTLAVSGARDGDGIRVVELDPDALTKSRARDLVGGKAFVSNGLTDRHGGQRVVIVDDQRMPCSEDCIGEIWISGPSVAAGYWRKSGETTETFGARLADGSRETFLRTGDLGFFRDRELYITGRLKDLVIVRGRNHYPQDLELTVEKSDPIMRSGCSAAFSFERDGEECVAVVAEVELKRITGDREAALGAAADRARRAVAEEHELSLHAVVLIDKGWIPKTTSGKIQRSASRAAWLGKSLAILHESTLDRVREIVIPVTDGERALVEIWSACLSRPVGTQDDFFALGGDSLAAVQIAAACAARGLAVTERAVREQATIARLAASLSAPVRSTTPSGPAPLLPSQHEFILALARPDVLMPMRVYELAPSVEPDHLEAVLDLLHRRHPALRLRFTQGDGRWQQTIEDPPGDEQLLAWLDVSNLPADKRDEAAYAVAQQNAKELCDRPHEGRLCRAILVERGDRPRLLILVMHHLITDQWSQILLTRDLIAQYDNVLRDHEPGDAMPGTDIATWGRTLEQLGRELDEGEIWRTSTRAIEPGWLGELFSFTTWHRGRADLTADETRALLGSAATLGVSVDELLAATAARALAKWSGRSMVAFNWLHHGRAFLPDGIDLSTTVGCVFRDWPHAIAAGDLDATLAAVREARSKVSRAGLGYDVLAHYGRDGELARELRGHPAMRVRINFRGDVDKEQVADPRFVRVPGVSLHSRPKNRRHALEVTLTIRGGQLGAAIRMRGSDADGSEALAAAFGAALRESARRG